MEKVRKLDQKSEKNTGERYKICLKKMGGNTAI